MQRRVHDRGQSGRCSWGGGMAGAMVVWFMARFRVGAMAQAVVRAMIRATVRDVVGRT